MMYYILRRRDDEGLFGQFSQAELKELQQEGWRIKGRYPLFIPKNKNGIGVVR